MHALFVFSERGVVLEMHSLQVGEGSDSQAKHVATTPHFLLVLEAMAHGIFHGCIAVHDCVTSSFQFLESKVQSMALDFPPRGRSSQAASLQVPIKCCVMG